MVHHFYFIIEESGFGKSTKKYLSTWESYFGKTYRKNFIKKYEFFEKKFFC
jgi:hypothetical protein